MILPRLHAGLTLIETVAATALLASLIAACMPLLAGARRDLAATTRHLRDPAHQHLVRDAIDELTRQRPHLGTELAETDGPMRVEWTFQDTAFAAQAELLAEHVAQEGERRSSHAWIRLRLHGMELVRWTRIPAPDETEDRT